MATRRLAVVLAIAFAVVGGGAAVGARAPAARIVDEWEPGLSADDVGGRITVDGYGVGGLGLYRLDDGTLGVCVQADIGHTLDADYRPDDTPAVSDAPLAYLLWRYGSAQVSDVDAAALNALSWRYADAERSGGGPVWTGDGIAIGVDGKGRLADVEAAVATLATEATARRGPWELVDLVVSAAQDGTDVRVALRGPGGPVAGADVRIDAGGSSSTVVTDAQGVATVRRPGPVTGLVVAGASGPGPLVTWSASGSQRLAVAGPPVLARVERTIAPPATTTTIAASTTTTTTTTTTAPPATAPPSPATAPATSSAPATTPRPTLPATGAPGRDVARWASILFFGGALAVLIASGRPRRRQPSRRAGPER